ncbi:MAG: hypothetical protein CME71_06215 [Halobacteriovorax sp.]|mgnify:CR=1 FL=1|nr:hypothetical protein [Halobacteriovorax sp.]|tara:strand:+ start:188 stop:784 length:597 start_codon:yes stop_codon:yes gene_type:complete
MKLFVVAFWLYSGLSFAFSIDKNVYEASSLKPLTHSGSGRFDSYLSMDIPYEPVSKLFKFLEVKTGLSLTSRGEAHITVITPIEYFDVLKDKISIEEINLIAKEIQTSKFKILCLGQGAKELDGKLEQTFYLVVSSSDLLKIRKDIQTKFISNGGRAENFDPFKFYPHITLGFTKRDLHESDGIIKDTSSCMSNIKAE